MKRVLALSICFAAATASAEGLQDSIVDQLRDQGFTRIQISRTLLGRSRIVATTKTMTREIVINPATGTILRDYWEDRSKSGIAAELFNPKSGRDGTGTSSSGDDGDDGSDDGGEDASGGDEGDNSGDDGSSGGDEGSDGSDSDGSEGGDSDGASDGSDSDGSEGGDSDGGDSGGSDGGDGGEGDSDGGDGDGEGDD